jgi:thiamine biosynthesis lipoprotein ApbE
MRNIHKIFLLSFLSLILTGCGDTTSTTASSTETKERTNPLAGQMDALKKAKNLEAEMQKSVEDRLKAIDGQK